MAPHPREHHFECQLTWTGAAPGADFSYDTYSRSYRVTTAGKPEFLGSAAPAFRGDPARHNPEDLLVASLAACHCLTYLALAARAGIAVRSYEDQATGVMAIVDGKMRFREVALHPRVGLAPGTDLEAARRLHEQAHAGCFVANSVNFPVTNEPTLHHAD